MKRSSAKSPFDMLRRVENIEKEVMGLKLNLLKNLTPTGRKIISLKGILKGVVITEEDISSAKKSLYSKIGV
jgi:hypothetical protein